MGCVGSFLFLLTLKHLTSCNNIYTMRGHPLPGGYSPLHHFSMESRYVARNFEEFKTIVSNPGPFSVKYSRDYLEWYWKAYQTKVKNHEKKSEFENKDCNEMLDSHTPRHLYTMPPTSARRKEHERAKAGAQLVIDRCARRHALLDVWERKPQYPHIDLFNSVTSWHIHELVRKFLDLSVSVASFWIRIVMFATLIIHKYPETFSKVAPQLKEVIEKVSWDRSSKAAGNSPTKRLHDMMNNLLRRYDIHNAVEASLVLSCLERDSLSALNVQTDSPKINLQEYHFVSLHTHVPQSTDALFKEENLALLRCYLYAEMNSWVPSPVFRAHPAAKEVVTLPSSDLSRIPSPESVQFFFAASVPQIRRLETRLKEATMIHRQIALQDDKYINPRTLYNPKTFRAEIRDEINIKMERALLKYEGASRSLKPRSPEEEAEELASQGSTQVKPSLYFFARRLKAEPTVSLALSMDSGGEVRRRLFDAAKEMYLERLHYFDDRLRYLHNQQSKVALTLLDKAIEDTIRHHEKLFGSRLHLGAGAALFLNGSHVPLAERHFDEYGAHSRQTRENYARRYISPMDRPSAEQSFSTTTSSEGTESSVHGDTQNLEDMPTSPESP